MCSGTPCLRNWVFNLSAPSIVNVLNASPPVRCKKFFAKENQYRLPRNVTKGFIFLKRQKNQFLMLLEMFIVLEGTGYNKIVSMLMRGNIMMKTVTIISNVKRAATFWRFLLGTKSQQICCLEVLVHIALYKRRVLTPTMKNFLLFWRNFPTNHNRPHKSLYQEKANTFPVMA